MFAVGESAASEERGGAGTVIRIDTLSKPEFIDLNHRIVARLRFLQEVRAHSTMLAFRIGHHVTFPPRGWAR